MSDDLALRAPAWSRSAFGSPRSFQNLALHHFCAPTKDIAIRNARLERKCPALTQCYVASEIHDHSVCNVLWRPSRRLSITRKLVSQQSAKQMETATLMILWVKESITFPSDLAPSSLDRWAARDLGTQCQTVGLVDLYVGLCANCISELQQWEETSGKLRPLHWPGRIVLGNEIVCL